MSSSNTSSCEYGFQQSVEWLKQYNKNSNKTNKKKNKVNLFFEECLVYVDPDDKRWINIFSNAIIGKFPRHFRYKNDTNSIQYSYRNKKETIKLDSNPLVATNQFINFIQNNGRIYSKNDEQQLNMKKKDIEWCEIVGENKKLELIGYYAVSLCEKHQLCAQKYYSKIKNLVNIGFILGKINNNDIVMNDNHITEIKNITFNQKYDKFMIKFDDKRKISSKKNKFNFVSNEYYLGKRIKLKDIYKSNLNLKKRTNTFVQQFLSDTLTSNAISEIKIIDASADIDIVDNTIDTYGTTDTVDTIST